MQELLARLIWPPMRDQLPARYIGGPADLYFNVGLWFGWLVGGAVFIFVWISAAISLWILGIPFGWIPAAAMGKMAFYAVAWTWGAIVALMAVGIAISCAIIWWPH